MLFFIYVFISEFAFESEILIENEYIFYQSKKSFLAKKSSSLIKKIPIAGVEPASIDLESIALTDMLYRFFVIKRFKKKIAILQYLRLFK